MNPLVQAQMKTYDEALALFHQQKYAKAKQELEKVLEGPSKELADRARMHIKIAEQRMKPQAEQNPRTAEEHYQRGVAMMNLGRWDEARESLDKARKLAPKADHIVYAVAALDCLTGEADAALQASALLEAEGFLVTAIRPPTVPAGTARLRFTFTAAHPDHNIERLADVVRRRILLG